MSSKTLSYQLWLTPALLCQGVDRMFVTLDGKATWPTSTTAWTQGVWGFFFWVWSYTQQPAFGCLLPFTAPEVCQPLHLWTSSTHWSCRTWCIPINFLQRIELDQLMRKEEREAFLLAVKAIRSVRNSKMKLGSCFPLTWLMGASTSAPGRVALIHLSNGLLQSFY